MGRSRHFDEQSGSGRAKRRKIDDGNNTESTQQQQHVEIKSHRQLRDLLSYQQGAQEVRQGVRIFKDFLASIGDTRDVSPAATATTNRETNLRILKSYCDHQTIKPTDETEHSPPACFPDLLATWTYADSNNDGTLLTLLPSILASFLKTVSPYPDFHPFCTSLCKHLLQRDQLRLINRAFQAPKAKEHLISPCLRLLTEMVSFDSGAVAGLVFARREVTFKRLETFLVTGKNASESAGKRGPTLRRIAQRYVLANLRYQRGQCKEELLGMGKVVRGFLEEIRRDARDMVVDILRALDACVVSDAGVSRGVKSRVMNRWNLERLVTLYGYEKDAEVPAGEGEANVVEEVHKLLMGVCRDTEKGVLLSETGWYPAGSTPDVLPPRDKHSIPLGLDSPIYLDRHHSDGTAPALPIRNGNLAALIQTLRPESDTLQTTLLLTCFRAAPELVYDYFSKRTGMFTSDPKPTPTWLGESALLFSTIQLPALKDCGWKDGVARPVVVPPPPFVVIESVLPRPLTRKILTRCLNINADIITIFAVRVLTLALKKLQAVLRIFNQDRPHAHPVRHLWTQASTQLTELFIQRVPALKDVIALFRATDKKDLGQLNAVLELVAVYYEVLPAVAQEERFDVSLVLVEVLGRLNGGEVDGGEKETLYGMLENLLGIAQSATSLRWWQRPGGLEFSAFTSVLKVLVLAGRGKDEETPTDDIKTLLRDVLLENSVLSGPRAFDALLGSVENKDGEVLGVQLAFLDNCVTRVVKKPVMYLDLVEALKLKLKSGDDDSDGLVSLLVAAVVEQWPYVVKAGDADKETMIAGWIARFLGLLVTAGEARGPLEKARDAVLGATTENKKAQSALKKAFKHVDKNAAVDADGDHDLSSPAKPNDQPSHHLQTKAQSHSHSQPELTLAYVEAELTNTFGALPSEPTSHSALTKWDRVDVDTALEQGHVAGLVLCLCSAHAEIRLQARNAIAKFMRKLLESEHPDKAGVYMVLGEVLETARSMSPDEPLPYVAGELGSALLTVVMDPLHKLYGKVNRFLNKGPRWEVAKIPSYFVDRILLNEPEGEEGWGEEVGWLLAVLVVGLRTKVDLDVYRRANVFERCLSLYQSPAMTGGLRREVLRLCCRAMQVEGGATTLVTRAAAVGWIMGQVAMLGEEGNREVLKRLAVMVEGRSDGEWVGRWSAGEVKRVVGRIIA